MTVQITGMVPTRPTKTIGDFSAAVQQRFGSAPTVVSSAARAAAANPRASAATAGSFVETRRMPRINGSVSLGRATVVTPENHLEPSPRSATFSGAGGGGGGGGGGSVVSGSSSATCTDCEEKIEKANDSLWLVLAAVLLLGGGL